MRKFESFLLVLLSSGVISLAYLQNLETEILKNNEKKENYRLPQTIFPERYKVTLEPVLEGNFNFTGFTEIEATVASNTREIALHYRRLRLRNYQVYSDRVEIQVVNTTYNNVTEIFTMHLQSELIAGTSVRMFFEFEGILGTDNTGFYRSSYYDPKGLRRWLAVTQFQSTHARAAFPCFDEPLFKAKFILFIRRPKHLTAVTNMPKFVSQETWDSVLDIFQESPRMSSYLVAILVSDFSSLTQAESNVRIWAKPDSIQFGHYALDYGKKVLLYLEDLLKQKNAVPKTDMVAVPDFNAGAMENWGLITYRETRLLHDANETSVDVKQAIAAVISHECTHMWFGNLLSPKWWEYTWLSEGFARYFQSMATSKVFRHFI